jgi:hypothetical protein
VAAAASVRNAEFFGEEWVWLEPAVIMPGRTLHVGRSGHVAGDAGVARAAVGVVRMGHGVDGHRQSAAGHDTTGRGVALEAQ